MNEHSRSVESAYFDWLCGLVSSTTNPNPERSYTLLLEQMHRKRFIWFVPNDDNRVEDGRELRYEFLNEAVEEDEVCSFLEMLIALSRRVCYEASWGSPLEWFWHLSDNLGLRQYNDETFMEIDPLEIHYILDRVVDRAYGRNGHGGLFPLDHPKFDQRKVELWYQMSSYLLEGHGP